MYLKDLKTNKVFIKKNDTEGMELLKSGNYEQLSKEEYYIYLNNQEPTASLGNYIKKDPPKARFLADVDRSVAPLFIARSKKEGFDAPNKYLAFILEAIAGGANITFIEKKTFSYLQEKHRR